MDNSTNLSQQLGQTRQKLQGTDYYGQAGQQLGVQAARERSQQLRSILRGTEQSLRGVESSVSGRTQGSNVSEAQRARMVNLERDPIARVFSEQQGALSDEDAMYRSLLAEAGQQAGGRMQADVSALGSLGTQFGTTVGSETSAAERALQDALAQRQLSFDREKMAQEAALTREKIAAERAAATRYQPDWTSILAGLNRGVSAAPAAKAAPPVQTYANTGGEVLGYDTPYQSAQTDAGWRQQENQDFWDRLGKTTQDVVTGVGGVWNRLRGIGW